MDLDALGNIGEFVGALGVVASLVYLAVQVRQNTASVRAATFQALAQSYSDFASLIGSDGEVARILHAGSSDPEAGTELERFRFNFLLVAATRRWENAFYQHERGMLDASQWEGLQAGALLSLRTPGGRAWWRAFGHIYYSAAFRDWVDASLAKP